MAVYKRGNVYWVDFWYLGKRIKESTKTSRRTLAVAFEKGRRLELERAYAGLPAEESARRIRSVSDAIKPYLETFHVNHRTKSVVSAKGRLKHIERLMGSVLLPDLTEQRILAYVNCRLSEGVCGRTVNMELQQLAQAIGRPWRVLWPRIRKLEERQDVGRALSPEEQRRLLEAIPRVRQAPMLGAFVRLALLSGMRSDEIRTLQWSQCDLERRMVTVGRAKTSSGTGREIPMNESLYAVLSAHASWYAARFGAIRPAFYLFPWGSPQPSDPRRAVTSFKHAWETLREEAGVDCRLHDLRHCFATALAEAGVPEGTMLALMGHMSRRMLEKYSHIRVKAKRDAMDSISIGVPPKVPPLAQSRVVNLTVNN